MECPAGFTLNTNNSDVCCSGMTIISASLYGLDWAFVTKRGMWCASTGATVRQKTKKIRQIYELKTSVVVGFITGKEQSGTISHMTRPDRHRRRRQREGERCLRKIAGTQRQSNR